MQLATAAVRDAFQYAGVDFENQPPASIGVAFGARPPVATMTEFYERVLREGARFADPGLFPQASTSFAACHVSITMGFRAFNSTLANGDTAGLDAVAYAASMLRTGRGEVAAAGGVHALAPEELLRLEAHNLLTADTHGCDPVCRPFDARRNGILLGEGSSAVILEPLETALAKGHRPIVEVKGYASNFDPPLLCGTGRRGEGAKMAMQAALNSAGLQPGDVDVVLASANGGVLCDAVESQALAALFPPKSRVPWITSIKSSIGETRSAGGAFQVAGGALMIETSCIPPVLNFERPGRSCWPIPVTKPTTVKQVRNVLVNAISARGNNSSMVLTTVQQ
jgi:3-oxoacyl-[acyl-carrier-protein] synthase II